MATPKRSCNWSSVRAAEQSLRSGAAFLLAARAKAAAPAARGSSANSWREFIAFGVRSDEWVTGYAGSALAEAGLPEAVEGALSAWEWLAEQPAKHGPGFGFNTHTPQDADSTLWACRLAATLNRSGHPCCIQALAFVRNCAQPDGGIASYTAESLRPLNVGTGEAIAGWTTAHDCVTAGAAWLPEVRDRVDVCGYLAATQQNDGSWRSYWWMDHEYATAFAVEALARAGMYSDAVERGAGWLARGRHRDSPFVIALRALGLAAARD